MENASTLLIKSFGLPKETRELVENCYQLKIKHFGRRVLHPLKPLTFIIPPRISKGPPQGKYGKFYIQRPTGKLFVSFEVDFADSEPVIKLFYTTDATQLDGGSEQTIKTESQELKFGTRWYFNCECGKRCNILYLSARSQSFGCRKCLNLTYESSRINKRTMGGLLYYTHKKLKLAQARERIDRISYKGHPTKRATRFFGMLENWENQVSEETKSQIHRQLAQVCA